METVLDVIINPRGAVEGAKRVGTALSGMTKEAQTAVSQLNDKFNTIKNAVFSVQGAFLALGMGLVVRDAINLAIGLERAERGLRALTVSGSAASLQLERIRDIGDRFQLFDDVALANSFRLLASHGVRDAEAALTTISNAVAQTGQDVETLTQAVLSGQERALRKVGIGLIDLGQGEVDLVFGNMEIRAKKTDQAIRSGLLQLLEKGFPDATKLMGDSMEFQFKRVMDRIEDLQVSVLRGGLKDAATAVLKTIADSVSDEDVDALGKKISDGILKGLEKIAKGTAFVIDTLTPLGRLLFGAIESAFAAFERLPPEAQAIGIIGFIFLGPAGRATLVAALALADKLGLKLDEVSKAATTTGTNLALSSPFGYAMRKGMELFSGQDLSRTPKDLPGDPYYIGLGTVLRPEETGNLSNLLNPEKVNTAQTATEKFFNNLKKNLDETKQKAAAAKEELTKGGGALLKGITGLSENDRKVEAQIEDMKNQARDLRQLEADKRDIGFSQVQADNQKKALDTINSLERTGLTLNEQQKDAVHGVFEGIASAQQQTATWNTELEVTKSQFERLNTLLARTSDALRDATDEEEVMSQALGASRRESEIKLGIARQLQRDNVKLSSEQFEWLMRQAEALAQQEAKLNAIKFAEEKRLATYEKLSALADSTRDSEQGRSAPSFATRLDADLREAARRGAPLDGGQTIRRGAEIAAEMDAERADSLAKLNLQLEREYDNLYQLNLQGGKMRQDREVENRIIQEKFRLLEQGHELSVREEMDLREKLKLMQSQRELGRMRDAVNTFVDSFEVGWDTIARSGQNAYRTLEDGLVQFLQTGQMNFGNFMRFVEQELLRLAIRNLFQQAITGIGGGAGISGFFSSFFAGGAAPAGAASTSGFAAAAGGLSGSFATGGSFVVGGGGATDSQVVKFRATPGERVTITTPNQTLGGNAVNIGITINAGGGGQGTQQSGPAMPNFNQLARDISKLVESKIIEEQRPGGLLATRG